MILNEIHLANTTASLCKSDVLKQKTLIKRACQGFYILIHNEVVSDGDLDWIQTSNLLSRNQVRYSVAPRGRFETIKCFVSGCKYRKIE